MYENDKRIVLTLDAGGTNFVFSAIRGNEQIVNPICMPSASDDLNRCLDTLITGFDAVIGQLDALPVAISFAFPGPADYKNGVIGGNLPNFPSFRKGVALGPFYSVTIIFRCLLKMTGTCLLMEKHCQGCFRK